MPECVEKNKLALLPPVHSRTDVTRDHMTGRHHCSWVQFRVKMTTADDEKTTDIVVEGDKEEIERFCKVRRVTRIAPAAS